MTDPLGGLRLAADELASVDSFRKVKDTAVLTIMFTDIVGFTALTDAKGEQHSNEVRRLHDEVLESVITADGAGVIVKHIGDAVMAVFSEPSTAVERAIRIHDWLGRLAKARPDLDPIEVKIGLDMGQVTVEDAIDPDVFGRHVNRASRVEGLASGGRVLMTYNVFDSARAWLSTPKNEGLIWKSHGRYRLKGVSAPVEIFEVADGSRGSIPTLRKGDRVRSVPGGAWAAGLILLGALGAMAFGRFQSTEVWLAQYAPPLSYLDGVELRLEGEPGDNERRVLLDVRPGRHVLHYDVADPVRYYAELDLERGENHVRAGFMESRLPTLYRYTALGEEREVGTREGSYFFYEGSELDRLDRTASIEIAVEVLPADAPGEVEASFEWALRIDGDEVASDRRAMTRAGDATEPHRDEFEIYSDAHHSYFVRLRVARQTAHIDMLARFAPVTPR